MRFGTAKEIITPAQKTKISCAGIFDADFEYIHDDAFIRCLVCDDGNKKAVYMSADLLFHDRCLNNEIAEYANEKYGIDKSAVTLAYTHAHTSPASKGYNHGHYEEGYEVFLLERAKTCLDRALCSMFDGSFEYGSFTSELNVSRRGNIDGEFQNMPSFDYPRDTELFLLCVRDTFGRVRSVVVNYACHPTFYPARNSISAEYPGRLCQLLDASYYGCVSVFFQSACGDVRPAVAVRRNEDGTPISITKDMRFSDIWRNDFTFEDIDSFAKALAGDVCSHIEKGELKSATLSIAAQSFEILLPMERKPRSFFEERAKKLENHRDCPDKANAEYILGGVYENLPDTMRLFCSVLKMADGFYIATMGGEPCFGVKQAVRAAFGDNDVCFIGYTDSCAYIVSDRMLDEGGYEPCCHLEFCHVGPFLHPLDEKYRDGFENAVRMLEEGKNR